MKLIILDRDGVINQDSDHYIKSTAEWVPIPGSIEAIAELSQAGYRVMVATNQSGVGRGLFSLGDLDAMHRKMHALVESAGGRIDGVYYCPHTPEAQCDCRKPRPGLLQQIQEQVGASIKGCWLVGDSLRDLQAGQALGCQAVLVRTGKGERTLAKGEGLEQALIFDDLASVARSLLASPAG